MKIEEIEEGIRASIEVKKNILDQNKYANILSDVVDLCVDSLKNGGCIFFCGNGGSAADAQHLAAELTGRYGFDREPLRGEALHTDTSFMTAVANDYGYEQVYARLLKGKARKGDVLIAISTSGNSANVCNAMDVANKMGLDVVALTGSKGGEMKGKCHHWLGVPSDCTPRIQESHILLGHLLCEGIENALFKK